MAAYKYNYDALCLLIERYKVMGSPDLVNAQDIWGKTPLHHAVYHGFGQGVHTLIHFGGAKQHIRDKLGKTPRDYYRGPRPAVPFSVDRASSPPGASVDEERQAS